MLRNLSFLPPEAARVTYVILAAIAAALSPVTQQQAQAQTAINRATATEEIPSPAGETAGATSDLPKPAGSEIQNQPVDWWNSAVTQPILPYDRWVSFDLDTVLLDTLQHSPRIQSVSHRTSVAMEKIVQQDAAFDPTLLLETGIGRTNDPVGNTLTTGGPPRLVEESLDASAGIRRTLRDGTTVDLSQEIGLLDSNSQFFEPSNQGNARLSLSLTKPLRAGSGRLYNERLLTQARISSDISWQEMRGEVEKRILDVISAYWNLYQRRCHLMQQDRLIERGSKIQEILEGRSAFDSSRVEIAKARQRTARRTDQRLQLRAALSIEQARLASLIGSEHLQSDSQQLEFIPLEAPIFPAFDVELRDAVLQGIENRPEVRAAASELESAALSIRVTRNELLPSLNAIVDTYLAGLNGRSRVGASLIDQFTETGPGISAALQYQMPQGRRAALSKHREAQHRFQQKNAELQEIIREIRLQIETALIDFHRTVAQQSTKKQLLLTAIEEEEILTERWEMMAGDGGNVGTVLESLLDAQQRTTDAEREWVAAQTEYLVGFVNLQRAMGTLLMHERITTIGGTKCVLHPGDATIEFVRDAMTTNQAPAFLETGLNQEPLTEKAIEP